MGSVAARAIRQMNEALASETNGWEIDFIPVGSWFRPVKNEENTFMLGLPMYNPTVFVYFYLDDSHFVLEKVGVVEGNVSHKLIKEELETLQEVFDHILFEKGNLL